MTAAATGVVWWQVWGPYGSRVVHPSQRGFQYRDAATGQQVIAFNVRGSGRPNVWSFMDGDRVVRMEIDGNEDGAVDRWEYYDGSGALQRAYERDPSGERKQVEP